MQVAFAPGVVCGQSLTQAQVQDRQHACTRCAEDEMPDPKRYRLWKTKMVQQAQSSSMASNRAWKGFLWTLLTVLTLAALLFGAKTSHFSTGTSVQTSVSNAWCTYFPHTQLSVLSNHLPAFYSDTHSCSAKAPSLFPDIKPNVEAQSSAVQGTADQGVSASLLKEAEQLIPASSKLIPEVKHSIQALSQAGVSANAQQPADSGLTLSLPNSAKKSVPASDALFPEIKHNVQERSGSLAAQEHAPPQTGSGWSLFRNAEQLPKAIARPVDWALEHSLLRTAELECDLAVVHDENQQLSAHLLSASRQLAAIGQTVQLPQDGQAPAPTVQLNQNKAAAAAAVLLLSLACISCAIWAMTKGCSRCSNQETSQHNFAQQVQDMQSYRDKLERQTEKQQQEVTQAEHTIMTLTSSKVAVETRLRSSQQRVAGLQADLARAECLLDSHAVAKMKLPLFPMSPLAAPPVKHDKDKENSGRPAKTAPSQAAAQRESKATSPEQPEREALLNRLKHMEAEKAILEARVATLQAEQVGLKDACRKADEQRTKMQLDTEALELRVFTTHEQLAVSEEREAELVAAVQEAKQSAAAARQTLAANQQAVKPQPSSVLQDEQEQEVSNLRQNHQQASGSDSTEQQECSEAPANSHTDPATGSEGTAEPATEAQVLEHHVSQSNSTDSGASSDKPGDAYLPAAAQTAVADVTGEYFDDDEVASATIAGEAVPTAEVHSSTAVDSSSTSEIASTNDACTASVDMDLQDRGHLPAVVCRVSGGEHGRVANSMQSSPIYGVASQAFTPTQRNRLAQNAKQGPRTPWSADWVTSFFGSGAKSNASRRAGSISPTRLFEFNGGNTVPEPEDLFNCWHGKLNSLGSPSRT
ncbi:TPA: hypothetical protein ACH3X1_000371 [Trebouxia sp. C0004]